MSPLPTRIPRVPGPDYAGDIRGSKPRVSSHTGNEHGQMSGGLEAVVAATNVSLSTRLQG